MADKNKNDSFAEKLENLKFYFDEEAWQELSFYEKKRFIKIKSNYEDLIVMGVNPALPSFMRQKKRLEVTTAQKDPKQRKICSETSKTNLPIKTEPISPVPENEQAEDDVEIVEEVVRRNAYRPRILWENIPLSNGEPYIPDEGDQKSIHLFMEAMRKNLDRLNLLCEACDSDACGSKEPSDNEPRRRYPKRNVPKVCYQEEELSSDDDYIYCDECGEQYDGSCPTHGPLIFIQDKKAHHGPRYAWNTCPDYLSVCRSGIRGAGNGIWTEKNLRKGIVFGPYKGRIVRTLKEAKESGYAWQIRRSGKVLHYVEGFDTSVSNWMRFVNCAMCEERQNLIAFQYHGKIFYRVYKEVSAYTELLVWYGDDFGADLGIFRKEEQLSLKSGTKKIDCCKRVASLSSTGEGFCRQTVSYPSKSIFRKQSFRRTVISPDVLNEGNRLTVSPISECVNAGIFTQNIAVEKSGDEKKDCSVSEESMFPKGRSKQVKVSNSKIIPYNYLQSLHSDYKTVKSSIFRNTLDEAQKDKITYKCQKCDYKTSRGAHLKRHIAAVHEGKKPYKCGMCDYRTSQAINLRTHIHEVHEGKKPYKCVKCDYSASRAEFLRIHIDAVHECKKPYKCGKCGYRASQAQHLRTHIDAVHEGKKPYKCVKCDYRASEARSLRRHIDAVHEGKKPYKCGMCDYRTSQAINLRRHIHAVHEGKKPYKCVKCDYSASRAESLRIHIDAVHECKKPYKCGKCDYRASQALHLRTHIDAVHEGKKPYMCVKCDYRASEARSLRRHIDAVHEGKKPYKCVKCDYRASLAGNLRRHIDAVHEGKKPYKCVKCDYRASQAGNLRTHMDAIHEGKKR